MINFFRRDCELFQPYIDPKTNKEILIDPKLDKTEISEYKAK